jgi:hypothetical protein
VNYVPQAGRRRQVQRADHLQAISGTPDLLLGVARETSRGISALPAMLYDLVNSSGTETLSAADRTSRVLKVTLRSHRSTEPM